MMSTILLEYNNLHSDRKKEVNVQWQQADDPYPPH